MLSRAREESNSERVDVASRVDNIDVRAQFWSRRSIYNIHLLYHIYLQPPGGQPN
jgi:hypothetical protein